MKILNNINDFLNHSLFKRRPDLGLLILRLSTGGLMLLHGISKLMHGASAIEAIVEEAGLPIFFTYGVFIGELIAPIFIIIGLATRGASLILAFNCVVAALLVHSSHFFTLDITGGWIAELLGLFFFGSLVLAFTDGGKYAVSKKYIWD